VRNQQDFWAGLLFLVCGLGFAGGATRYPLGSSAQPGPGYFPLGLGLLLALLGAFMLFRALTIEADGGGRVGAWAWRPLIVIVGAVAVFGWALPHLGLFVAIPLLVIGAALAGEEFRWQEALVNAVVLTSASWLIFNQGLQLRLPLWPAA
jgi:hypothetical protein